MFKHRLYVCVSCKLTNSRGPKHHKKSYYSAVVAKEYVYSILDSSLSGETGGFIRLQDLQEVKVFARGLAVNCTLKTLM